MSSNSHDMADPNPWEEIELTGRFSEEMALLCMNQDYSDVTFVVDGAKLPAHRVILAARSEYFRAMLYGGMSESSQSEIVLKVPLEAFRALLRYIYSGQMSLAQMREEDVLDTLGLANQYGFSELETAISSYLRQVLSLDNVCAVLDAARLYAFENLMSVCHTFLERNTNEILKHESFKSLSEESLIGLLQRDSFSAPEVSIFLAVREWCAANPDSNIDLVVSHVRLPLMEIKQLLTVVRPSNIIDSDRLLDAIEKKITSKSLPYRGALWPEENVASLKFDSRTIQGELRSSLLDGDTDSYDMERGYTRHTISESNDQGIVVELGSISIINHIKILLWDKDVRSYCYYIEVSVNQQYWERVIDHREYNCRSWQYLYFPARAVRYIRLVGTHNTVNKVFHVVSLEAMYTANVPPLHNGIVAPVNNVATLEMSAIVVDGVSRTRNVLLNGDVTNYDWDYGFTCHQLVSGMILVQLGQPYYIGSLRLLLWDLDDRNYCFFIETSTNRKNWELVVDKRGEPVRSWQHFTFPPRPVVFIKIVGTYNTNNEIFHCVHFECPSQKPAYLRALKEGEITNPQQSSSTQTSQADMSPEAASPSADAAQRRI
ncbi:BTB/POZ domain-containing protein 9 [Phlebotomus argentipes]|uniref:BTB/POZ domain-containing protein 9 n=1 Tax=Phlebotomus argentipes TaxID=94469 RepID=UPI002892B842|nr:BTB/POZ domain-containing protein 9 [Phlebotomus argentipes]